MFINKLQQNHGMLFIFDDEGEYTFWMKNTYIPLDIIYVSKAMKVNKIFKNVRASFYNESDETVPKVTGFGKYVIELNSNMSEKIGLREDMYLNIKCVN